ncbi:MAG: DNA cytosine methyltransferase, partial [Verrucomicrobiia bacterium]
MLDSSQMVGVDLFCGVGGLTHGLVAAGIRVAAGIDIDPACRFPYETNNAAKFIQRNVTTLKTQEINELFGGAKLKLLAGCPPCQPFSTYAWRYRLDKDDPRRSLINEFWRIAQGIMPDVIVMENVPLINLEPDFNDFVDHLVGCGYYVSHSVIDCSQYGVPQRRRRRILMASRHGAIKLIPPVTRRPKTVRQAIGNLPPLGAGQADPGDPLHVAAALSPKNLERIRHSIQGGTWKDWPSHLVTPCHQSQRGNSYADIYGRMAWDEPSPTLTTKCYGFGNGRFGHPEQDRGISLREAAILQSFPPNYAFLPSGTRVEFKTMGRLIGNAVPVELGRVIGFSILRHFNIETPSCAVEPQDLQYR